VVFCDNISTIYMSSNPVQHQRTKHIEIDLTSSANMLLLVMLRYNMFP
jgi:hypothetical protein